MHRATSVEDYIAHAPAATRAHLEEMRALMRRIAPQADETISYGMPGYKLNGASVYFGGFKAHVSFFPGSVLSAFAKELVGYKTSKGTLQLPLDEPLPKALITRITKQRFASKPGTKPAAKKTPAKKK